MQEFKGMLFLTTQSSTSTNKWIALSAKIVFFVAWLSIIAVLPSVECRKNRMWDDEEDKVGILADEVSGYWRLTEW